MKIYEKTLVVSSEDLDLRNHVNNVRYVQWVQDIAEENWTKSTSEVIREHYYWVMISHHITYKAEAFLGDKLLLKTYVTKSEGVRSTRVVSIYNASTGKQLTSSETIWCFISQNNNRPTRITQEVMDLFD